jgi:hypothetical protein
MNLKEELIQWIIKKGQENEPGKSLYPMNSNANIGLQFLYKYSSGVTYLAAPDGSDDKSYYILSTVPVHDFEGRVRDIVNRANIPDSHIERFLMENI